MIQRIFHWSVMALLVVSIFAASSTVAAKEADTTLSNTEVVLFTSPTCPHCHTAQAFFRKLKTAHPELKITDYEMARNPELAQQYYEQYSVPQDRQGFVPAIYIGNTFYVGFDEAIQQEIGTRIGGSSSTPESKQQVQKKEGSFRDTVLGAQFSLPVLAVVLGVLDGFNVCSLGALALILGLVLILRSRKKIFVYGSTFLLTTGVVYTALIFLWHTFFTVVSPLIPGMQVIIGVLSIVGGIYLLREFYLAYKRGPVCTSNNMMSRMVPRLQKVISTQTNSLAVIGTIIVFAAAVTIIEFPCSALLPVLFTSMLVDAGLTGVQSAYHIGLYMLFYLLDEVILFVIAVYSMKLKIVSPGWIVFFNLAGAALFLGLGIYYLSGFF